MKASSNASTTSLSLAIHMTQYQSDFKMINTPPTLLMQNNPDPTLDLLTCNIKDNTQHVTLTPDLGSNHLAIQFSLDMDKEPEEFPFLLDCIQLAGRLWSIAI